MTADEIAKLSRISKQAWKQLANADQSDGDEVKAILTETLEAIDNLEEQAAQLATGSSAIQLAT